jgi:hypothetical protein
VRTRACRAVRTPAGQFGQGRRRDLVEAGDPRDLLDEVRLALDVAPKARRRDQEMRPLGL